MHEGSITADALGVAMSVLRLVRCIEDGALMQVEFSGFPASEKRRH